MTVSAASFLSLRPASASKDDAIRPFHINIAKDELVHLRERLTGTRWPDREIVTNQSQGVQLKTIQQVVQYWRTDYDWRKVEARLNALPQFITE